VSLRTQPEFLAPARTLTLQLPPTGNVAARNERESLATTPDLNNGTGNGTAGYLTRHNA
tara:strand:+ start:5159 stop:5335 length:177 start_codon:yes stop_codon:yes gene_type:complete